MSLILMSPFRRKEQLLYPLPAASEVAPYGPIVECSIPIPNGAVGTIHPSVVDMGTRWNGYRWWMANTPMPDAYENPHIYGSNDRITWTPVRPGNEPLDPGDPYLFNSDNVLVWDDENSRMVCFWRGRDIKEAGEPFYFRARTSTNGVDWTPAVNVWDFADRLLTSPQIIPAPTGGWWAIHTRRSSTPGSIQAPDLLGPWSLGPILAQDDQVNHSSAIRLPSGTYISIGGAVGSSLCLTFKSTDGYTWTKQGFVGLGIMVSAYHATLTLSTKPGWVDVWAAGYIDAPACATYYTRAPLSVWGL